VSPDFWGRGIIQRLADTIFLTEIDYLLLSPDDRIGALTFSRGQTYEPPDASFNSVMDLERLQEVADEVVFGSYGDIYSPESTMMADMLRLSSSLGGMRPKTVVSDGGSLWIAKFNSPFDRWNNAATEHMMLRLAHGCGINAAESRLFHAGGRDILLVKRFDRHGAARSRMVSALTVLRTDDFTSDSDKWSYVALAEELRRFSANPKKDGRELFMRMVFNALTTNNDDHPRNHAFLANGEWRLSPAYDLTPMPQISIDRRDLAMICGAHGRIASRSNLLTECRRFMLEPDEAEHIIDSMAEYIKNNWRSYAADAGVTKQDAETIAPAFLYPGFFR
jgi:serine/threonine-protein kinase HipA